MSNKSQIISFSLVGCGRIAKRHSDLLGNNIIKNAKFNVELCIYPGGHKIGIEYLRKMKLAIKQKK